MNLLRVISLAVLVAVFSACNVNSKDAGGEGPKSDSSAFVNANVPQGEKTGLSEKDARFLSEMAVSNREDIAISQLAQQKGENQEVKDMAKMLETDNSALLSDLTTLSADKGVALPEDKKDSTKVEYSLLNQKTGKEFDKYWCGHMIQLHQQRIIRFEASQPELTDVDVKTWTNKTLPKLKTYLDKLKQCSNRLK